MLSRIRQGLDSPLCVLRDFNEIIIYQNEKKGDRLRPGKQLIDFRKVLQDNNLIDIGWRGQKFTWCNMHKDNTFIKERLDRAMANQVWWENLGSSGVEVLNFVRSDHLPFYSVQE